MVLRFQRFLGDDWMNHIENCSWIWMGVCLNFWNLYFGSSVLLSFWGGVFHGFSKRPCRFDQNFMDSKPFFFLIVLTPIPLTIGLLPVLATMLIMFIFLMVLMVVNPKFSILRKIKKKLGGKPCLFIFSAQPANV